MSKKIPWHKWGREFARLRVSEGGDETLPDRARIADRVALGVGFATAGITLPASGHAVVVVTKCMAALRHKPSAAGSRVVWSPHGEKPRRLGLRTRSR